MAKEQKEQKDAAPAAQERHVEQQAREQTGQRQVQLRIDESKLQAAYANAFRTNGTAEEIILDFGLNLVEPPARPDASAQILFQANHRIILNYFSAKRLAITLSQMIRRHESQFGDIELDVARRQKPTASA